jgi:hypothetical protein
MGRANGEENPMIESVITGLIYLCLVVLAIYLVIMVLNHIGVTIPDNIMKIIWVIVLLFAILIIVRTILPGLGIKRVDLPFSYLIGVV